MFVDGGRVPPGTFEVRRAALIINYTPKNERKITQRELELSIGKELENVPDIRYWFLDENGLRAVSLVVTGADSSIVGNVASELATQMKRIPLISDVISETSLDRPELRIQPRADLAARLGVSTESLSQTIRVATIGDVGPALAKFDAGDRLVPIRVQLEDAARGDLPMLEQLRVPLGEHGEKGGVPLSVVADIKLDQGPTSINRYDRERQATVAADLVGSAALGDATKKIYELPVMKSLPKGVKVSPSGDAESLNELSQGFATAITAGLMMVYAVLVLLFGTFLQPITILFSLPLSIGGAIVALLLTGKQLTTPVWIGMLMLMGIVTKNAIMLVEFAVESIREGKPRDEAIIDAGMKRARPIVMTTIAMAAGMMPSALAFGAGGEFRSPMALAVIGGLVFSTVLSLVFVPAMFMMMDDLGRLFWRFGKKALATRRRERASAGRSSQPITSRRRASCIRPRRNKTSAEPDRGRTAMRRCAATRCAPPRSAGHVLQQNPAALQVQNAVLAPLLQLTVDAFARRTDEHAELLLRDMHLGAEIGGQRAEPSRQPYRQRLQHRFLHPLALPANPLAQQLDQLDRDARLAFEMARKSSRRSTNNSVGSPAVASAVRLWPSSTATSPNRSPGPRKFRVRRLPSEAPVSIRIWPRRTPNRASPLSPFWNSTSPTASCWVWQRPDIRCNSSAPRSANIGFIFKITANSACLLIAMPSGATSNVIEDSVHNFARLEVCHKSHNFAAPPDYFWRFELFPRSGISLDDQPRPPTVAPDRCRLPGLECRHESTENCRRRHRCRDALS